VIHLDKGEYLFTSQFWQGGLVPDPQVAHARPTAQARGRRTLERLLDAAEYILEHDGLEAATVPAIAERAGVSVGNVYKRFPDKDALMRAVYERFFQRSAESNRTALTPERWKNSSAEQIVRSLVRGMVHAYTQHRALLSALVQYAESHADREFRLHAEALRADAFERITALLLTRRKDVGHADPKKAAEFALVVVGLVLRGTLMKQPNQLHPYASSPEKLARELTRMVLAYLEVPISDSRPRAASR
jgi:AcrR family transcriptional regulator